MASYTLIETGKFWKKNQHGGKRGSGTDHMLVSLWDSILSNLDDPNILATTLVGVDFSKSFSRCSFQQILLAYKDLNASQWCIDMHAAFLTGRHMQVKVGNVLSEQISVSGGAVQGSILGVLDHNAVLENIDNEFVLPASKYVDDMTLEESTNKCIARVVDFDDDLGKECHTFHVNKTQKTLEKLEEECEIKGLKLNENKTQLLSISAGRVSTRSWIKTRNGTPIYSSPT